MHVSLPWILVYQPHMFANTFNECLLRFESYVGSKVWSTENLAFATKLFIIFTFNLVYNQLIMAVY